MYNMQRVLKQVQQVQEALARIQAELAEERVEGTAGGGTVRAVCNGQGDLLSVTIDPSVVDPQEVSMLEDLVVAATRDALQKARDLAATRMKAVTGGLQLPGFLGPGT
jgi:DNA-binding YbaB/EbfC family protein